MELNGMKYYCEKGNMRTGYNNIEGVQYYFYPEDHFSRVKIDDNNEYMINIKGLRCDENIDIDNGEFVINSNGELSN